PSGPGWNGGWPRFADPIFPGLSKSPSLLRRLVETADTCGEFDKEDVMTDHKIGSREEWQAAREELLQREKEHTRIGDELARRRRELPWGGVGKEYRVGTDEGPGAPAELFDGRSQLLVYHFMFGPSYEAGCPACTSMADTINGVLPHLHARDVTVLLVSRTPLESLEAYKRRMGWSIPWASTAGND